ncbi:MAG: hypothetical protein JJE37_05630 [Methyloceanibacter sp.]|nr:hypothetical protein [Methyloceanibacter sp.]
MDAPVTKCVKCGGPLPERRKLKHFCSYSCRGQHAVETLDGPKYQSALVGSKNTRKTKALQSLRKASIAGIAFVKINSITYRIDRPSKRGVGWLMEVAWPGETRQRWVARIGNQASEPLPLEEAKRAAAAMLHNRAKAERDWIRELNQIAAIEVDRTVIQRERRKWPVDLMGGRQRGPVDPYLRQAILDTERVLNTPETT